MKEVNDVSGSILSIPISKIIVRDRQRQDYGDIVSLQLSVEQKGLQYPIIVQPEGEDFILLAGGRRLQAFKNLQRSVIPAIFKENLNEIDRQELELEENLVRKNLNYLEEAMAIAKLDRLKREKYGSSLPGRFSPRGGWTQKDTAKALNLSEGKVSQDIQIFEAIEKHPELRDLPTRRDVLREIRKIEDGIVSKSTSSSIQRQQESFVSLSPDLALAQLSRESIDLAFVDLIPDIGSTEFSTFVTKIKLAGQGFVFFSFEKMPRIMEYLKENSCHYSERPFIWHVRGKDDYLPFFWFSKGIALPPKALAWHMSHSPDKDNIHTFAKPHELYFELISKTSTKGSIVVNLTAHDTTCVRTCIELGRVVRAFCPSQLLFDQYQISFKEI